MFFPKVSWVSNVFVKHQRSALHTRKIYKKAILQACYEKSVTQRSRIILVEARKYCFILRDRMPGRKLLPLLTRSFASRDKDVRSRKRTRVERRETTTRWNTTKRAKVWIVIFFGLVPRWRSRARVPFRNSALRCFVPRFIRMKRGITRVSRRSGPFDSNQLTKRKIMWNNCEKTRAMIDQYRWSFPRFEIYLVVTRSRCYSDFGNDLLSIDFEIRDQIRHPVKRDRRWSRSDSRSWIAPLDGRSGAPPSRWDWIADGEKKGGGMVKNRGVAICYLPFSTFGSNYSSAMRFDSARSGAFSSGRVESRSSICIFLGSRDLDRSRRDHSGRRSIAILSNSISSSPDSIREGTISIFNLLFFSRFLRSSGFSKFPRIEILFTRMKF